MYWRKLYTIWSLVRDSLLFFYTTRAWDAIAFDRQKNHLIPYSGGMFSPVNSCWENKMLLYWWKSPRPKLNSLNWECCFGFASLFPPSRFQFSWLNCVSPNLITEGGSIFTCRPHYIRTFNKMFTQWAFWWLYHLKNLLWWWGFSRGIFANYELTLWTFQNSTLLPGIPREMAK